MCICHPAPRSLTFEARGKGIARGARELGDGYRRRVQVQLRLVQPCGLLGLPLATTEGRSGGAKYS